MFIVAVIIHRTASNFYEYYLFVTIVKSMRWNGIEAEAEDDVKAKVKKKSHIHTSEWEWMIPIWKKLACVPPSMLRFDANRTCLTFIYIFIENESG